MVAGDIEIRGGKRVQILKGQLTAHIQILHGISLSSHFFDPQKLVGIRIKTTNGRRLIKMIYPVFLYNYSVLKHQTNTFFRRDKF
ncbi:hypothetical protein ElyMa_000083600 [Elysia marginata]|uniref:Uncharacterized protein n=1 Tax=Elysia marginata TaxID=1093978 RepID=A0AAV4EJ11_9GAST|nr:hypothetical protein ElyMa_000083600 [Elysia marginata]